MQGKRSHLSTVCFDYLHSQRKKLHTTAQAASDHAAGRKSTKRGAPKSDLEETGRHNHVPVDVDKLPNEDSRGNNETDWVPSVIAEDAESDSDESSISYSDDDDPEEILKEFLEPPSLHQVFEDVAGGTEPDNEIYRKLDSADEDEQVEEVWDGAGRVIGMRQGIRLIWEKYEGAEDVMDDPVDIYQPFCSALDWKIAHWCMKEIGQGALNRLLAIPEVVSTTIHFTSELIDIYF